MTTYETRHQTIVKLAADICVLEVEGLDADECRKSAGDAATNTYQEGISDEAWLEQTLAALGRRDILIVAA